MPSRPQIPRNILIIAFVALFSGFGQDLITPILPGYLTLLGLSHASIGIIDGLLNGTTYFFRFVSGIISDRLKNRKKLVFLGYSLSSIARPLLAFTSTFWPIALLRSLDGIGKGTKDAPRDALVADSATTANRGRAFGFHRLVDTAGSVFGPLLAGFLLLTIGASLSSYHTIFLIAVIPGSIALTLIWFGIKEPPIITTTTSTDKTKLPTIFWLFTAISALAWLTKPNDSLVLARTLEFGLSAAWLPIVFAGFTLIYAIFSYPIGVLSDRLGRLPMIAIGWIILAAAELGFSHLTSITPLILSFILYGLFFAFTEGSGRALIADLVHPNARASAYAIFYTITSTSIIAGGYLTGLVLDHFTSPIAYTIAAIGSIIAGLSFSLLAQRNGRLKP